ncbi:MAG: class I SAM-dependent methyltransferase [Candidatus Hydrogenedentes bacterium]|nr:class I SAM-dependent methyltransferase [Candidatus Hydrogenedentota bacterium]
MNDCPSIAEALLLLAGAGWPLPDSCKEKLGEYVRLIEAFNPALHLTSAGDRKRLALHTVDSLSLLPWLSRGEDAYLLDIGSGGGFPAIPLLLCGQGKGRLVERSGKKCDFLRSVVSRLALTGVEVIEGDFPRVGGIVDANCVTARAVERPEKILQAVLKHLPEEVLFLCQMGGDVPSDMFHVEHVDDEWGRRGWRRGELRIVRRIVPRGTLPTL